MSKNSLVRELALPILATILGPATVAAAAPATAAPPTTAAATPFRIEPFDLVTTPTDAHFSRHGPSEVALEHLSRPSGPIVELSVGVNLTPRGPTHNVCSVVRSTSARSRRIAAQA